MVCSYGIMFGANSAYIQQWTVDCSETKRCMQKIMKMFCRINKEMLLHFPKCIFSFLICLIINEFKHIYSI